MRLDRTRVDELKQRVEEEIATRGLKSCQYALALDGEVIVTETLGDAPADARYVIWSCTKVLPSAVVWQLMGEDALDPALPVTTWWPEFGENGKDQITLEQLLAHSAGLPSRSVDPDAYEDRERRLEQIEAWTLEWEPGTRFEYHGLSSYWVVAELIERITGMDPRAAIRERLLDPLDLPRLELGVPAAQQADVQPMVLTGSQATPEEVEAEVGPKIARLLEPFLALPVTHPDDDPVLGPIAAPSGLAAGVPGGGAVSDASSLALLYQALLHNTKGLWDPALLRRATRTVVNSCPDPMGSPAARVLGIESAGGGSRDDRRRRLGSGFTSGEAFGHPGAGGQVAWADPGTGLSFVFLTNGWDANIVRVVQRERALNEHATRCVAGRADETLT